MPERRALELQEKQKFRRKQDKRHPIMPLLQFTTMNYTSHTWLVENCLGHEMG